jgi:hypothetical protein
MALRSNCAIFLRFALHEFQFIYKSTINVYSTPGVAHRHAVKFPIIDVISSVKHESNNFQFGHSGF